MEEEDIQNPMDTINDMESAGFIQKDVVKSIDTNILSLDEKIDKIINNDSIPLIEKSKELVTLKTEIRKEQNHIDTLIEKISELNPAKNKKYKMKTIEDLTKLFDEEENLNSKIKIYQNICYKIDKFKSQLFDD
tara:strand:+ start:156 stop:557 length:402 start_codon:yes stop_codon:yes gene_type:complete